MEEDDQKSKHICKFCHKIFPCGRSLGGHMRSHLINFSSSDHQNQKTDKRLPKKKQFLLKEKVCKQCGKSFKSWKALFGHMKSHRVVEEDSFNTSSSENQKLIVDSQSDDKAATPLCRRKRSKRYTNPSSLNAQNFSSSCVSEIDEQEQEEVALSLILLSMDAGNSGGESFNNSSEFITEAKKNKFLDAISGGSESLKFKKLRNGKLEPTILHSETAPIKEREFRTPDKNPSFKLLLEKNEENLVIEESDSEVNSPKYMIKKNQFEENKKKLNKRKCIDSELEYKSALASDQSEICQDFETINKFTCTICNKVFPSYQALGGHRASHKKFKGCCAPNPNKPFIKSEDLSDVFKTKIDGEIGLKKSKEHECPICFRVFSSGQALGGHKRSHLIVDQGKTSSSTNPSVEAPKQVPEIREFLDLNLPAPVEDDFQTWWIGTGHKLEPETLLGLISN